MTKPWSWLGPLLTWLWTHIMVGFCFYQIGHTNGRLLERGENLDVCYCGDKRTCPFGPGIVGEQRCRSGYDKNVWTRCEPVPVKP